MHNGVCRGIKLVFKSKQIEKTIVELLPTDSYLQANSSHIVNRVWPDFTGGSHTSLLLISSHIVSAFAAK